MNPWLTPSRERWLWAALSLVVLAGLPAGERILAAERPLRVGVIADQEREAAAARLRGALQERGFVAEGATYRGETAGFGGLALLAGLDAAVVWVERKPLTREERAAWENFLAAGKGLLVLGSGAETWANWPEFDLEVPGGRRGEPLANGVPVEVVNLLPHAILSGVSHLGTQESIYQYTELPEDAAIILEGVIGETAAPLGWLRQRGAGRVFRLALATGALLDDARYRRVLTQGLLWTARRPIPGAGAIVQRTFMPESHPGSFAINFPQGPSVCYDPVRGGINYIWDGDFTDLRPRWLTKQGKPANPLGELFYQESAWQPMRNGRPEAEPVYQFLGYRLTQGYPEFRYSISGRSVTETLRPLPDAVGIARHFAVTKGPLPLWLKVPNDPRVDIAIEGAEKAGEYVRFDGAEGGAFTVEIRRKGGVTP